MGYRLLWIARPEGRWLRSSIFETPELAHATTSARGPQAVSWRVVTEEDEPGWQRSNRWFGEPWPFPDLPAPICEDYRLQIATPDHEDCFGCDEPILPSDSGTQMPFLDTTGPRMVYQHAECGLRSVMCPIDMGLVDDVFGRHQHEFSQRREEAKLIMQQARQRVSSERL